MATRHEPTIYDGPHARDNQAMQWKETMVTPRSSLRGIPYCYERDELVHQVLVRHPEGIEHGDIDTELGVTPSLTYESLWRLREARQTHRVGRRWFPGTPQRATLDDERRWQAVEAWCEWHLGDGSWAGEIKEVYEDPESAMEQLQMEKEA